MKLHAVSILIVGTCLVAALHGRAFAGQNTVAGAATGGALGAVAGAVIGHQSRHAGEGALIGGAVGAVAGALAGNAIDRVEQKSQSGTACGSAGTCSGRRLTVADVRAMAAAGVPDEIIIQQIRATGSRFALSAGDIIELHKQGVSSAVIKFMIETGTTPEPVAGPDKCASASRTVHSTQTVVVPAIPATTVVVPACPPPVVVASPPKVVVVPRPVLHGCIGHRTHHTRVFVHAAWAW